MGLKKFDILVRCESCRVVACHSGDSFDVTVPLVDLQSAGQGNATLQCVVSDDGHRVALRSFVDDTGAEMALPGGTEQRVSHMLRHVAEQRVCGNRHVCPDEVVRLVTARSKDGGGGSS